MIEVKFFVIMQNSVKVIEIVNGIKQTHINFIEGKTCDNMSIIKYIRTLQPSAIAGAYPLKLFNDESIEMVIKVSSASIVAKTIPRIIPQVIILRFLILSFTNLKG